MIIDEGLEFVWSSTNLPFVYLSAYKGAFMAVNKIPICRHTIKFLEYIDIWDLFFSK